MFSLKDLPSFLLDRPSDARFRTNFAATYYQQPSRSRRSSRWERHGHRRMDRYELSGEDGVGETKVVSERVC